MLTQRRAPLTTGTAQANPTPAQACQKQVLGLVHFGAPFNPGSSFRI